MRVPLSRMILVVLAASALATPAATSAAKPPDFHVSAFGTQIFYVAPSGSDGGTGSEADPFATFQKAIDELSKAGGTVLARGGTYHDQRFVVRDREHIRLEAYPGEQPVLDLSGVQPPKGRSGVVEIRNGRDVAVRGLEITGYRTTSQQRVPMGIYAHGGVTGLTLANNHVHHMGNDNDELGSPDINAHGIAVYGTRRNLPTTRLRIIGNEVDHLALGASESVVVNGNVRGWRISGNHIHDNNNIGIDAIGYEGTIRGRSQWCNCADGIYVDGGKNILIRDNIVRASDIGIEVASEWRRGGTESCTTP